MRRLSPIRTATGLVLLMIGAVWFMQGIGSLTGSVMTGKAIWAIIGAVVFIAGLIVLYRPVRPAPPKDDDSP